MRPIDRQVDEVTRPRDEALVDAAAVGVRAADRAAGAGVRPIDVAGADRQAGGVAGPGDEPVPRYRLINLIRLRSVFRESSHPNAV
jgi:hypothetical protein